MAAARAGRLIASQVDPAAPLTVADAAARTGLALRDAESGLKWLSTEYRGRLRVTSDGELVHVFPSGFSKPWEGADARRRAAHAVGRALAGAVRFVVRAWVAVVLVGYAAFFVGLLIAMAFARQGNDSRRDDQLPGGELGYVFLRVVSDALFWTFHPWSPVSMYGYSGAGGWSAGGASRRFARSSEPKVPLYERVNRFFFGPTPPAEDPRETERRVLAAIRAGKGRVGLADVMRVTGLPRDKADPMMARLMLDYDGDVEVSEEGGIFYRFEALRKTVEEVPTARPQPIWTRFKKLVPLTGNEPGTNLTIAALNGFNLLMSWFALTEHMTVEKIGWLFQMAQHHFPRGMAPPEPVTGTAIALGVVPLVFSIALFALPLARAAYRPLKQRRVARENGRRAMLREILEHVGTGEVTDTSLRAAWKAAAGEEPDEKELTREVAALGGDVDYESGKVKYRFPDLEAEAKALEAEREAAAESEAKVGNVVFSSED
jgi:hypothetical protein